MPSSRRQFLTRTMTAGALTTLPSVTIVAYDDDEEGTGTVEAGTLDFLLNRANNPYRVPDTGNLLIAPGETRTFQVPLTNSGSTAGNVIGLDLSTQVSGEGSDNPTSETNTATSDGGELDDVLAIRAYIERDGTIEGYLYGSPSTTVAYQTAVNQPEQELQLASPIGPGTSPTPVLTVQITYLTASSAVVSDTLAFDLTTSLKSTTAVETVGWEDPEQISVFLQASSSLQVTQLTAAEYNALPYQQAAVGQGRIGSTTTTEHRTGPTVGAPAQTANRNWTNGETRSFTLSFDSTTGRLTYTNQGVTTLTYTPTVTGSYTDLLIAAQSSRTLFRRGSILVANLTMNGTPITEQLNFSNGTAGALRLQGLRFDRGFTLTGTARMSWNIFRPAANSQYYRLQVGRVTASGSASIQSDIGTQSTIQIPADGPISRQ